MKKECWYKRNWLLLLLCGIVVIMWIVYIVAMNLQFRGDSGLREVGTFGDMFGALNTLFTGLAFAGVIVSIVQQNKSLEQQQESLQEQKEEIKLYKSELEKNNFHLGLQIRNQQTQKFETTFFNLVNIYKVNVSDLRTSSTHNYGLDLIRETVEIYHNKEYPRPIDLMELGIHISTIIPEFKNIYEQVIFILKFIEEEMKTDQRKPFYGMVLANQLTNNEKIFLTAILKYEEKNNADKEYVKYVRDCFERYNILIVTP